MSKEDINNENLNNEKNNDLNLEVLYIIKEAYSDFYYGETFIVFESKDGILSLIYTKSKNSIISFDLKNNKKINEIKSAHNNYIYNYRHCFDKNNQRDLFLSLSSNNDIKIWNFKNLECLIHIKDIYKYGNIYSACFFKDEKK